jgi:hypothetical protein
MIFENYSNKNLGAGPTNGYKVPNHLKTLVNLETSEDND